jgi:trk system potassium uptake protein TrkA
MTMRIIICGAGSTGRHVAEVLGEVHDVTVIDRLEDRCVPGRRFVHGDAADPAVRHEAGAADADALVSTTADDPTNLLIAHLAKTRFGVASTVARMNEPSHRWLFTAAAGVDVVVSAAELVTRLLQEEVTAGDLVTLLELRGGGVAVTETASRRAPRSPATVRPSSRFPRAWPLPPWYGPTRSSCRIAPARSTRATSSWHSASPGASTSCTISSRAGSASCAGSVP